MKSIYVTCLFLMVSGLALPVEAGRREHRPWFSVAGKSEKEPVKARRIEKPRREARAARRERRSDRAAHRQERKTPEKGRKIAHQALKYEGTPYRYGGKTRNGLDCSGLVQRVYSDLRYEKIPRTSRALYKRGKSVDRGSLRPGDLVFFKNTYRKGISHVGIYTGGNRFVHAFNRRYGVTVTPLNDPYFAHRYAGARRLY